MKRNWKSVVGLGMAAVMTLGMTGAAVFAEESERETVTIGFAFRSLDEAMTGWWGETERAIEEYNADDSNPYIIETLFTNADLSVDTQLANVDSLIVREPDVICIQCVDTNGDVPAFEACVDAGIPVIDYGFGIAYEDYTASLLTIDHYGAGVAQADWVKAWLDANPDETLYCGYLNGAQGIEQMTQRYEGWCTIYDDPAYKDRISELDMQYCNFSAETAQSTMEDWMQTFPEINCAVSANDEMLMGAMQAAAGANVSMVSLGMDATATGLQGIKDGLESATIGFDFIKIADRGLELAMAVATGEEFEKVTDISAEVTYIVDSTNVDEYL